MNLRRTLDELFHHDELARKAEAELLAGRDKALLCRTLTDEARRLLGREGAEAEARLERIAGLLEQVASGEAVATLLDLLDGPHDAAREAAGEALVTLGEERLALLRSGLRTFLGAEGRAEGPALAEIPYVVASIDDPEAVDLLLELLEDRRAVVVASALEVAGEQGLDPRVRDAVSRLRGDARTVLVEEEDGEAELTIGEIAGDVLEALGALDGDGA
jgi:HEAT repeat protein